MDLVPGLRLASSSRSTSERSLPRRSNDQPRSIRRIPPIALLVASVDSLDSAGARDRPVVAAQALLSWATGRDVLGVDASSPHDAAIAGQLLHNLRSDCAAGRLTIAATGDESQE
jgi:hypothetical protein